MVTEVRTTCPYCGVGCGIKAKINADKIIIEGDTQHPANKGRLCSKGSALASTMSLKGRLLSPRIRCDTGFEDIGWDQALDMASAKFRQIIDRYGPDSVAFYVSGQLLSEDYYVVNKLAKGFIGTANIDTNSRLCMSSAVTAHKMAFGADLVSGTYEDVISADLLIFSGHNAAWTHPVLFRQIEDNSSQFRVCIDPKLTDTAKASDLHLMIAPQSDVRLWNGLCAYLIAHEAIDYEFVATHTEGFDALHQALLAQDQSLLAIARDCDLDIAILKAFYDRFLQTPKTVSLFSMGSNQSAQGVNKALSLIHAHLLTGRIGKVGATPFSMTGQPNAMGGREVGGLANMLAAHMEFTPHDIECVRRYWQAPHMAQQAGLKAVDMFDAVESGKIKAIWIMATNPMVSMPNSNKIRKALQKCELVIVSDVVESNDSLDLAHIQLPAAAWGEKNGCVTNSERVISRQRPLRPLPGQVRPDWAIVADFARRLFPAHSHAFNWSSVDEVFAEYAGLTAFENKGRRVLNLAGLTGLDKQAYEALKPTRWPVRAVSDSSPSASGRLFEDGQFATASKKARLSPVLAHGPALTTCAEFPLALNTSRVRDHWHSMTRTALAPELSRHASEAMVDIHPQMAQTLGLANGALATIKTAFGQSIFRARLSDQVRLNDICVPMHWSRQWASHSHANPLVSSSHDARSGQPEFKHTPARIEPYNELWHGFILLRQSQSIEDVSSYLPEFRHDFVWSKRLYSQCALYEIAGKTDITDYLSLCEPASLSLDDDSQGLHRKIFIRDNHLQSLIFIAPKTHGLPPRDWLAQRFADERLAPKDRAALILGRLSEFKDRGRIICACHGIGEADIIAAMSSGAQTVEAIGDCTKASTQCGSCKIELKSLIAAHKPLRV